MSTSRSCWIIQTHVTSWWRLSNSRARATVPREISRALMGARLTALGKPDGGVTHCPEDSGKAVSETFRERECVFPVPVRTFHQGVHRLYAEPTATVLKVDGIGAYDHVFRAEQAVRISGRCPLRLPTSMFCTVSSQMLSSGFQAYNCTEVRPKCETDLTQCQRAWRSWVPMCGKRKTSPSWGRQSGQWSTSGRR